MQQRDRVCAVPGVSRLAGEVIAALGPEAMAGAATMATNSAMKGASACGRRAEEAEIGACVEQTIEISIAPTPTGLTS